MPRWTVKYMLAVAMAMNTAIAAAADTPLTLAETIARVLEHNPQLQAAEFDARAAAERVRQQAQAMPWELGLELENLAGSGELAGADRLETTLSLGRVLESGNKARLRTEVAQLEAGVLQYEQDAARLDLLAVAAQHFLALARVQAGRELAQQQVELMQRTLQSVQQRYHVGKAPAAERSRARIDLAQAELALEESEHLLLNGRRELSVMWGEFEPDFVRVQADIFNLAAEPDFATLKRHIENNPAVARLATEQRLSQARLVLAKSRGRPDLDLKAGVRHLSDQGDTGLVLSLSVPLGSSGRAGPWVNEAGALAGREQLSAQDRRLALLAMLSGLYQEMLHARDSFEVYRDRIIPEAESALEDYSKGYAVGRYSLLELTAARQTLLEARLELLSAAADHHSARIEIDRLVGVAPVPGATPAGVNQ